jgi:hypothetical protein
MLKIALGLPCVQMKVLVLVYDGDGGRLCWWLGE